MAFHALVRRCTARERSCTGCGNRLIAVSSPVRES
jgi:hypothetical protein